jgi:predicted GNAT superfamily acetyltransferase
MSGDAIVIRRVEAQAEYDECVRIQDETWGAGFSERVPGAILKVAQYLGGVTAAAFVDQDREERMLGFVFGMTGIRDGLLVHWSDMLAVRPEARNRGIGRRLKLYQRSLVVELGVRQMLWTFDPLVSRNAHLNLNCLGARVTEYVPDMYGADTGSALHEGIGTDRFVVAWDLTAERVPSGRVGSGAGESGTAGQRGSGTVEKLPKKNAAEIVVEIPEDIQDLIATESGTARVWRDSTRAAFLRHLADGYSVTGFHRADGRGYYRLTRGAD